MGPLGHKTKYKAYFMDISRLKSNETSQLDSLRIGIQDVKANRAASAATSQDANAAVEVPADEASLEGLEQMKNMVKQAQDMRLDLVASIKQMLAEGHDFSSADIAGALVDGGFGEYFTED